jgi:hypothetical protein
MGSGSTSATGAAKGMCATSVMTRIIAQAAADGLSLGAATRSAPFAARVQIGRSHEAIPTNGQQGLLTFYRGQEQWLPETRPEARK